MATYVVNDPTDFNVTFELIENKWYAKITYASKRKWIVPKGLIKLFRPKKEKITLRFTTFERDCVSIDFINGEYVYNGKSLKIPNIFILYLCKCYPSKIYISKVK